jgi:hypothetical protein
MDNNNITDIRRLLNRVQDAADARKAAETISLDKDASSEEMAAVLASLGRIEARQAETQATLALFDAYTAEIAASQARTEERITRLENLMADVVESMTPILDAPRQLKILSVVVGSLVTFFQEAVEKGNIKAALDDVKDVADEVLKPFLAEDVLPHAIATIEAVKADRERELESEPDDTNEPIPDVFLAWASNDAEPDPTADPLAFPSSDDIAQRQRYEMALMTAIKAIAKDASRANAPITPIWRVANAILKKRKLWRVREMLEYWRDSSSRDWPVAKNLLGQHLEAVMSWR